MNKYVAVPLAVLAFMAGIGFSTLLWNVTTREPAFAMNVEGNFGAVVTVTTTGTPASEGRQIRELIAGEGRVIDADNQVLLRATKFTAAGDEWSQVADLPTIVSGVANKSSVGKLADVVVGKHEGTRLAVIDPLADRTSMIIVDILPTRVTGQVQSQPTDPLIPVVSSDDDGVPVVGGVSTPIDNVRIFPVVSGQGAQVTQDDVVYANYVLAHADGTPIENTFTNGNPPAYIAVEDVFPGLHAGLLDQRVGSRIAISVPAAQAQGEEDVLIVLDILAISDEKPSAKNTSV
ncbi:hypothetical protein JTE88_04605 [Arcanobacterium phocisimile]|uniref:Peptidyl-prolyl cis-trans isomerase n=1 Tax=Arcanobacterium phocisimile TaxID=1302235 RepID=A0ABX7IFT1_9ACTO|nr:FKBP-type peptidyl-prolyl cis-trans isomerase [Arcanobacterium phocisimile]QRV01404.1 hypothetical protein JTE88_04605 [Arcanobacterium phocisimile]